jgi:hypothetical protein
MATNWITLTVSVVSTVRISTIHSIGIAGVITIRFTTILIITHHGTTHRGRLAGRLAGADSIRDLAGVGVTLITVGGMDITHIITVAGTTTGMVEVTTVAADTTTITEEVIPMANAVQQEPMFTVAMQAADHHLQQRCRQITDADQVL